ncbi:hypothetical protein ACI3LY_001562 [Candidozyma auris]|uniref:superoxide dismutase n=2 Tax=Candidozyma auris TaxID=498019 RepID=A0A2H0ZY32_CANAR|nr:hypothetical protein QG37_05332 [[Candida] auris]PIS55538.1 hypothetical protein B9J08_001640 [[Candida] auris]QWW22809.1 hypothetical protein CA7LBN_001556 [[Candida] auris]
MMFTRFSSVVSTILISGLASVVLAGVAPQITSNPSNVVAVAEFPMFGCGEMEGYVSFEAPYGKKVKVNVDVTRLPADGFPFLYHVHEFPVGDDGDCESVGPIFNPYHASPNCDAQDGDEYCKIGDLSGKHGQIQTTCFQTEYYDPYISLTAQSKGSIVGRSVVFHYSDMTKIACANIEYATEEQMERLRCDSDSEGDGEGADVIYDVNKRDEDGDGSSSSFGSYESAASTSSTESAYSETEYSPEIVTKVTNSSSYHHNKTTVTNYGQNSVCEEGGAASLNAAICALFGVLAPFFL